jgi:hypothetical protein
MNRLLIVAHPSLPVSFARVCVASPHPLSSLPLANPSSVLPFSLFSPTIQAACFPDTSLPMPPHSSPTRVRSRQQPLRQQQTQMQLFTVHNVDPAPPLKFTQVTCPVLNATPPPSANDHPFLPSANLRHTNILNPPGDVRCVHMLGSEWAFACSFFSLLEPHPASPTPQHSWRTSLPCWEHLPPSAFLAQL